MLNYNINLSKWIYSFYIFILFIIISFPLNYKLTNQLFKNIIKISSNDGCPTFYGLLIHTFIFLLLLRFFLQFNTFKEGNTESNDEFTDYEINDDLFTSDTVDMSDPSHRHNVDLSPLFDTKNSIHDLLIDYSSNAITLFENKNIREFITDNDLTNNLSNLFCSKVFMEDIFNISDFSDCSIDYILNVN